MSNLPQKILQWAQGNNCNTHVLGACFQLGRAFLRPDSQDSVLLGEGWMFQYFFRYELGLGLFQKNKEIVAPKYLFVQITHYHYENNRIDWTSLI